MRALGAVFLLWVLASSAAAEGQDRVTVEVRGDRLTLWAEQAPLAAVLAQLAKATGIVVRARVPLDEPVSLDLRDVLLEEALKRLLRFRSTVTVYHEEGGRGPAIVYVLGGRAWPVPPLVAGGPPPPPHSESELLEASRQVDAELVAMLPHPTARVDELNDELSRLVEEGSPQIFMWLEMLLEDSHPGARLMALQGLEQRRHLDLGRVAAAFKDPDLAVQQAALQILLSRGASDQAVETVRTAAEVYDEATLHQIIAAIGL